jgi:hypothetical protein
MMVGKICPTATYRRDRMDQLPTPIWNRYFGISGKKLVLAFDEDELMAKAAEFKLSDKACLGKIGNVGVVQTYEIFNGKMTKSKIELFEKIVGMWPKYNWTEIQEKGFTHPVFLPAHGCFGFINGNLILGNRHHQEVMFRLIEEKGWTWEQLVDAKQVWGWYYATGNQGSVNFSSDAGTMSSKKVKKDCMNQFEEWFSKKFVEGSGYGGKSKKTYGGDFEYKYGTPGNWTGHKAGYDSTIITPLPNPPKEN